MWQEQEQHGCGKSQHVKSQHGDGSPKKGKNQSPDLSASLLHYWQHVCFCLEKLRQGCQPKGKPSKKSPDIYSPQELVDRATIRSDNQVRFYLASLLVVFIVVTANVRL